MISYNFLLNVTQQRDSSEDPVIGILRCFEFHGRNVREIGSPGFLVDGTEVHAWIVTRRAVDGVYVNHGQWFKQNFGFWFDEADTSAIPSCTFQEETIHVHALRWGLRDVVLNVPRDVIVKHHSVQSPALVRTRHFLSHGSEESLWVEESCHPERVGAAVEAPGVELCVAFNQLREPETQRARVP